MKKENKSLNVMVNNLKRSHKILSQKNKEMHSKQFVYESIKARPKMFKYLCGLSIDQFELLWRCVLPYINLIEYPDCKGTGARALDKVTELFLLLTICRHGLHLGVAGFMVGLAESTIHRIYTGWIVFLSTLFNEINLSPTSHYLAQKMPDIFIKTGHGLTDIVIDCTEFRFQKPSNYDVNTLMFSNYKNTTTGKALIGITANGMGVFFSDVYPGSVSDSKLTEVSGVLHNVRAEHEIMADRGFAIQDLCACKGIFLNKPDQKSNPQFNPMEVSKNFDIAATRIHVERFIGRVGEWSILNHIWPIQRMDLLSSTWQTFCHIVNLKMPPIGPSEHT